MNIGNQGSMATARAHLGIDIPEVFGFYHSLRGEPYHIAAGFHYAHYLVGATHGIVGRSGGHRLHDYGGMATYSDGTHGYWARRASAIIEKVHSNE